MVVTSSEVRRMSANLTCMLATGNRGRVNGVPVLAGICLCEPVQTCSMPGCNSKCSCPRCDFVLMEERAPAHHLAALHLRMNLIQLLDTQPSCHSQRTDHSLWCDS